MSDKKIRRKAFVASLGALALAWAALKGDGGRDRITGKKSESLLAGRVSKEPRATPYIG